MRRYIRLFENFEKLEFIWIHGLPGSGKSKLANNINDENPEKNFIILDDIPDIEQIKVHMNNKKNIILNSPYFDNWTGRISQEKNLRIILEDSEYYSVKEYWFENNPKACIENLKKRKEHKFSSGSLISEIGYESKLYKIPSSVKTIPVWSSNKG
jgi:energy-coupling factor transporter ATP-binding protein EcfA2